MVSKCHCKTLPITCCTVLNSSPGRLDLGGLGFKIPGFACQMAPASSSQHT